MTCLAPATLRARVHWRFLLLAFLVVCFSQGLRIVSPPQRRVRAATLCPPAHLALAVRALTFVHVQALNLPGAARRAGGVRWEQAWHTQVKRVHPASVWGTGAPNGALPQKPDPCPHKLLTFKDWDGAGTNNVIQALANALWVSRESNRTLLLSAAASDMMKALFDTARLAFVLVHSVLGSRFIHLTSFDLNPLPPAVCTGTSASSPQIAR